MMASPFVFYRGSACIMASDLATMPASGITVQACGDGVPITLLVTALAARWFQSRHI
jgi:hypothetical protein